ncbi:RICIN domain-containing protein [Kitasatospora sp. NPDC048298]|uniref:RICIN domain-containing protein n=1 Tax=Kitasatospora sp. NPDC048298 TaxID=3364049 RepID=UPI003711D189
MTVRIIRGKGVDACPQGYWALYDDVGFNKNGPADILIGDASVTNLKDVGFNDRASSYVNRTGHNIALYDDADYGGRRIGVSFSAAEKLVVHERTIRPYLFSDEEVGDMNDAVSSVQVFEPGPETARLGAGTYTIVNVGSGKALEVAEASPADGANVQQGEPGDSQAQQWRLAPLGDGIYTLTNQATGKRLDVAGGDDVKKTDGANVHQRQALDLDSQKWRLRLRPATGHYTLVNVFSGKALDVDGGSKAAGANVQQWADNDTDAQKWQVTPLNAPRVRKLVDAWPALRNLTFEDGVHGACPKPGGSEVYLFKDGRYLRYDIATDVLTLRPSNLGWRGVGLLVRGEAPDAGVVVPGSDTEVYLFKRENHGRYRTDTSPEAAVGDPGRIEPGWPGLAGTAFTAGVDAAANKPGTAGEVYLFRGDAFLVYDTARQSVTAGPAPIVEGWPGLQGTDFTSGLSAALAVPGSTGDIFLIKGGSLVRLPAAGPVAASSASTPTGRRSPAVGTYTLTNVGSGKALDATGDGSVVQWTGHGGANQRWTLAAVGDGVYTLTSVSSGKVLDVSGASRDDGARVQQWPGNGSGAQQWKVTEVGEGVFRLQCVGSGKYLDVKGKSRDDGGVVHQWGYDDSDSQKWRLAPAG